jgi:hypothetical protein
MNVPVPDTVECAYIGEWIFGVCEVPGGEERVLSIEVRDVGQSAIHVTGLCLCDVSVKRCYCSVCIIYERSVDKSLLLRNVSRNYRDVIQRCLGFRFLFGRIGIKSRHLYKHMSEKVVERGI